jgi:spermidine synthase
LPERADRFSLWLALYALCGFTGLALEMVWFRLCDVGAKSTAFTFGTVLALYLFGLAAGSLCGVAWVRELRRFIKWKTGRTPP